MTEIIHPGVFVVEGPAGHPIPGVSTSTSGLVGTELIHRLQALVPPPHKGWQDHDAHDPGVALLEVFAWLTEQLASRANEMPKAGHAYASRLARAATALSERSSGDATRKP